MTFYRMVASLRTATNLIYPYQIQALAATTRTAFELCVDIALLTRDLVPNGVEKFHQFTRVSRFSSAYKLVQFYNLHPDLESEHDAPEQRALVNRAGIEQEIESLCGHLWNRRTAPQHWSNLRWEQQSQIVGPQMEEHFVRMSSWFAWLVHGGGAGVGGISAGAFAGFEVKFRDLLRDIVPRAFRQVGAELHMHRAVTDFNEQLDFIETKVESLCAIDAQLQAQGRPSKFQ